MLCLHLSLIPVKMINQLYSYLFNNNNNSEDTTDRALPVEDDVEMQPLTRGQPDGHPQSQPALSNSRPSSSVGEDVVGRYVDPMEDAAITNGHHTEAVTRETTSEADTEAATRETTEAEAEAALEEKFKHLPAFLRKQAIRATTRPTCVGITIWALLLTLFLVTLVLIIYGSVGGGDLGDTAFAWLERIFMTCLAAILFLLVADTAWRFFTAYNVAKAISKCCPIFFHMLCHVSITLVMIFIIVYALPAPVSASVIKGVNTERQNSVVNTQSDTVAPEQPNLSNYRFDGFDCKVPHILKRLSVTNFCKLESSHVTYHETGKWEILQSRSHTLVTAIMCQRKVKNTLLRCGVYDHIKVLHSDFPTLYEPMSVSECARLVKSERFGPIRTTTGVREWKVGRQFLPVTFSFEEMTGGSNNIRPGNQQTCQGTTMTLQDTTGKNISVGDILSYRMTYIEIRELPITFYTPPDGHPIATTATGEKLPPDCLPTGAGCMTNQMTLSWSVTRRDSCEYNRVQTIEASVVSIKGRSGKYLISNDQSHVFLQLNTRLHPRYCGRISPISTNYQHVKVLKHEPSIMGDLHVLVNPLPQDLNLLEAGEIRSDFLYYKSLLAVSQNTILATKNKCMAYLNSVMSNNLHLPIDQPVNISSSSHQVFLSVMGEVVLLHSCKKVQVFSRTVNHDIEHSPSEHATLQKGQHCSLEMPIKYGAADMYLTPVTRLIVDVYRPIACTTSYGPMYRTITGQYVRALPSLHVVPNSEQPSLESHFDFLQEPVDPLRWANWTEGVDISTQNLVRWQRFLESPIIKEAAANELSSSIIETRYPSDSYYPSVLPQWGQHLPTIPTFAPGSISWLLSPLESLKPLFNTMDTVLNIVTKLLAIKTLFSWIHMLMGSFLLYLTRGTAEGNQVHRRRFNKRLGRLGRAYRGLRHTSDESTDGELRKVINARRKIAKYKRELTEQEGREQYYERVRQADEAIQRESDDNGDESEGYEMRALSGQGEARRASYRSSAGSRRSRQFEERDIPDQ